MGGQAFAADGLEAPRIPNELYKHLSNKYATELSRLFEHVTSAQAVTWKVDHGDIDMLVEGPRNELSAAQIAEALGAKAYKEHGPVLSFAMPHPEEPRRIVQLDIQLCPKAYLDWQTWQASYGDLGQIIGVIIRNLGLTATDKGLFVRIAEIEPTNKKASMIFLTKDPVQHIEFLGLDQEKLRAGFDSEEDLFKWVAGCRFLNRQNIVPKESGPAESETHNDRARRKKRGMYRAFVEEFLMNSPEIGTECQWDRQKVLDEALEVFGRRAEYETKLAAYLEQEGEKALWAAIKEVIPRNNGPSLKNIIKGLQRFVSVNNGKITLHESPVPDHEKKPWVRELGDAGEQGILEWVGHNWEAVRVKEKAHANAKKATTITTTTLPVLETTTTEVEMKKRKLNDGTESTITPLSTD
ncbi:hypothetical protein IWZ00DRAFT_326135 [Phyllosticta capitalensis]|uniref:Uncharacterized protein n=1 Tax=Phyllosticta capitalensis TaxID=121624 RepID=A0ABR1YGW3_9PEZI